VSDPFKTGRPGAFYGRPVTPLNKAAAFIATHGRLLDRRRFELATGIAEADAGADCLLAALAGYGNPDGGYGHGLEPDLRTATSQPCAALHAFEVFEQIAVGADARSAGAPLGADARSAGAPLGADARSAGAPLGTIPAAARLCDWLGSITLPDGGLPFALPIPDRAGCAPYFLDVDPNQSSLHMTSMLAGIAHRIARHDGAVREHPWLATATEYSLRRIRLAEWPGFALEFHYALWFLDAVHDVVPEAAGELSRLGRYLPASGCLAVAGGAEGEALRPLDFAPMPNRPVRALFTAETIQAELDGLVSEQRHDGGWAVNWTAFSPAAALEWRGYATVRAVSILTANGRVP
jgi:hypothetical protein